MSAPKRGAKPVAPFVSEIVSHFFPLNRKHPVGVEAGDRRPQERFLRGDVALAAVLLDCAGAKPDDFRRGVHVVLAPERLIAGVKEVIARTTGIEFSDNPAYRRDEQAVFVNGRFDEGSVISGLQARATMIGVAATAADLPSGFAAIADRTWTLRAPDRACLEKAIALMTGESASLPDRQYDPSAVLKAMRPGVAAAKVVANLKALHEDKWRDDAASASTAASKLSEANGEASEGETLDAKSRPKTEDSIVRLRDLAGYGAAKDWGMRLAADLADYRAGRLNWEDVDRGLLLSGPPGSGKTFFAAALAAECGVPLIRSSYADWEAGTGGGNLIAKAIKKAFADARKVAPCILFIDEIDSVGARGGRAHNSGWFDVVINALLAELDGAEPRPGVVVVGATNHPDEIDPALRRPGRLDRHVEIPRPTIDDLKGILAHHFGRLSGLGRAALACRGLTPAAVAQVAREARRAARAAKRDVVADDVVEIVAARRTRRDPKQDRLVCVHEAGHAIVALKLNLRVACVDADGGQTTIGAPAGPASLAEYEAHLAAMMGGRAAEIVVFGEPTSGPLLDLANATSLAYAAVARAGLAGSLIVLPDALALAQSDVRHRVEDLLAKAMDRATQIVSTHRAALDALAQALIEMRYLDGVEIRAVVQRRRRTVQTLRHRKGAINHEGRRS